MNATPSSPSSTLHATSATAADGIAERPRAGSKRALVLGGGGSAGNAWEIGVIAGLFAVGLDVTEADLIIGTSAGSTAAAQITSATRPTELLANILAAASQPRTAQVGADRGRVPNTPAANHMEKTSAIIGAAADAADMRRRMGAAALEMDAGSDGSAQTQRRATIAARLPSRQWPQRLMLIVAVDAHTGEPVVFDRRSGVDLVDAVTASCAGPGVPAHNIGANRYIEGGYRSNENADLAAGYGRVLVLSPLGGRSRAPQDWRIHLAAQVDELRESGSRVETVFPDSNSRDAFGVNLMDPSTRPPAARAGYDQGRALAAAHRILALTPTKPVDSARVMERAHASVGRARKRPCWFLEGFTKDHFAGYQESRIISAVAIEFPASARGEIGDLPGLMEV